MFTHPNTIRVNNDFISFPCNATRIKINFYDVCYATRWGSSISSSRFFVIVSVCVCVGFIPVCFFLFRFFLLRYIMSALNKSYPVIRKLD